MSEILDTLIGSTALLTMCVTVLATFAVTLIFKTSYTTNFAQGVIAALGAYVVAEIMLNYGWTVWAALPIGILAGLAVGVFIDTLVIRRGRNVNAIGKQIITMGFVTVIVGVVPLIFKVDALETKPAMPLFPIEERLNVFSDFGWSYNTLICLAITAVVLTILFILLYKSKWGLGVRATASNEYVAGMMGVNTHAITAISWAIAGAVGTLAAVMFTWRSAALNSVFMTTIQVNAFLACILGGFSTFYGPILAAVILCFIGNGLGVVGMYLDFLTRWKEVFVYVIALVIVLFKPEGMFGERSQRKV